MIDKGRVMRRAVGIALIGLMLAWAEWTGEREIIFPEMAAIVTGGLVSPIFSWQTSKVRIFLFIMIAAVLGMSIVAFLPVGLWLQLSLAFFLGQLLLLLSRTGFAPMISAIVLPVMLQTETPIYLLSAALLTQIVLIAILLFEGLGLKERRPFQPLSLDFSLANGLFQIKKVLVGMVMFALALAFNLPFLATPPLMVAFTEFANRKSKATASPVAIVVTMVVCALLGTLSRFFLTEWLGLPSYLSGMLAMFLVFSLFEKTKRFIPPAAALAILAYLIPVESLFIYPVAIFLGASLIMLAAKYLFIHDQGPF